VIWGGEFGRTPVAQGTDGRDHNPHGFTMWMAGGGVKGGIAYGATDDYGYYAAENKVHIHDLHATILHLLGMNHERLTYRYAGRDYKLTDLAGNVVKASQFRRNWATLLDEEELAGVQHGPEHVPTVGGVGVVGDGLEQGLFLGGGLAAHEAEIHGVDDGLAAFLLRLVQGAGDDGVAVHEVS
jgi:hypothetical protein